MKNKNKKTMKELLKDLVLVLVVLSTGVLLHNDSGMDLDNSINSAINSSVVVAGARGYGSGVIIKSDESGSLILTNKHVCDLGNAKMERELFGAINEFRILEGRHVKTGKRFRLQVVKTSENSDLCLLHTIKSELDTSNVATEKLKQGARVFNVSNPAGVMGYVSEGHLGKSTYIYQMLYRQVSVPYYGGSSGSGIFNRSGELTCLVSLGRDEEHLNYCVPLSHIKLFLKDVLGE